MSRRHKEEAPGPSGFLVVDKPADWTSHDVVNVARRWLGTRRVGHLGTLDPIATGVLPLAIRDATKLIQFLPEAIKEYRATLRLGVETDTLDAEGRVLHEHHGDLPDEPSVRGALQAFLGEIDQVPPMFSAIKLDGVPLHRMARAGKQVARAPRKVHIQELELLGYTPPRVEIAVRCSPGTYVRSLASDLGRNLGCGAHLEALTRTRSGPFHAEQALSLEAAEALVEQGGLEARLIDPVEALGLGCLSLDADQTRRLSHGGALRFAELVGEPPGTLYAALTPVGELLAVVELGPAGMVEPRRVFASVAGASRLW